MRVRLATERDERIVAARKAHSEAQRVERARKGDAEHAEREVRIARATVAKWEPLAVARREAHAAAVVAVEQAERAMKEIE